MNQQSTIEAFATSTAVSPRSPYSRSVNSKVLCNLQQPSPNTSPSPSRRRFLQALALVSLSATELSNPTAAEARIGKRDRLYDARSGSFVPASAMGGLMRRDVGTTFDRCIVAGEIHDNVCTHAAQFAVVENARKLPDGMPLTVGFEQFYRSHDPILNDYVERRISLDKMLKMVQWDNTWGFDAKLYVPIFEYCRIHRLPMVGLNVPFEFVRQVGAYGIDGIPEELKTYLPDNMDMHNRDHFQHFLQMIGWDASHQNNVHTPSGHSSGPHGVSIERYYQAQVLWEEWMSQSVAMSLNKRPGTRMVALIGSGHVEGRYGLPDRIEKRCSQRPYTIVPRAVGWLSDYGLDMPNIPRPEKGIADLVWYTQRKLDLV